MVQVSQTHNNKNKPIPSHAKATTKMITIALESQIALELQTNAYVTWCFD
eukprot:m.88374 g.88374  ORF g.88374 m.88374 type:complete len:50 (+) comp12856_c0_seq14:2157-2306(+)